jgi:hypothetical protein
MFIIEDLNITITLGVLPYCNVHIGNLRFFSHASLHQYVINATQQDATKPY